MSKSRWLTLKVVTTDSTCVAIAAADEHWAPRSVPSVSTVYPPKEMLTSPPSAWRAETCDCQPDWFGSDHWHPPPVAVAAPTATAMAAGSRGSRALLVERTSEALGTRRFSFHDWSAGQAPSRA